ncbi:phosphoribosylanthranilate isomerase [Pseudoxanthomonas kaohsiungensis]|uniref:phosphoribosylanthranilate isomerase n=1 Tax=Pseudoxanthomonas kaohsiungensis TaxID=283923 RepID=UPI0035AF3F89
MNRTLYRTRIKFCGLTRPGDVRLAGELGVDAVGFVFAPDSPRRLTAVEARQLRLALAPMVSVVALFRGNSAAEVREVVRQLRPSVLQFHGDEDDAFCRAFRVPWMKAIPMANGEAWDARTLQQRWPHADGFLFDSHGAGKGGGTGKAFDWSRIPTGLHRPFVLAGGITPDNVFDAIHATLPWAVDVASGIEVSPGIKDGEKMRRFVAEVRRADCAELD